MTDNTAPTWEGRVAPTRTLLAVVGLAGAALWGSTIWQFAAVDRIPMTWVLGVVALFVTVAVASTLGFRVRVDADGLTATSVLGWPRFNVALDEIASVTVSEVSALRDFRGYGVRRTTKATGIVLGSGPAIDITRTNGRRFVVVINDARSAAERLATLRAQS